MREPQGPGHGAKGYTVRHYGHIESLDYRDGQCQLWIQSNNAGTPRIYCADTLKLPFVDRERVLKNLCDYLETATNRAVLVVDERDKDRKDLERLIAQLAAEGHMIAIEYDSAQKQEQFEADWQRKWAGAGKKLKDRQQKQREDRP